MLVATLLGVGMAWRAGIDSFRRSWRGPYSASARALSIGPSSPTGLTAVYFAVALASAASKAKRAASSPLMRRVSSP